MKKYLIILVFAFLIPCLSFAQPPSGDQREGTYIVLLKAPSVVDKVIEMTPGQPRGVRRQILFSGAADEYQVSLERSQARTIQALTAPKPVTGPSGVQMSTRPRITVLDRRSFLLNMLVVRCSPDALLELRRFSIGEERAARELGRTLERRDRREVPDALQVRLAVGGSRALPGLSAKWNECENEESDERTELPHATLQGLRM